MSYSDQTLSFLESAGVTPLDLWHIPESCVPSVDGWREAWEEVRRGLEPTNTTRLSWDSPRRAEAQAEPPPKLRAGAGRRALPQWQGLSEQAASEPSRLVSDAERRRAAAEEAVEFLETWPLGLVAEARASCSADQNVGWKERFVSAMATSTDVKPRSACFRSLQRFCADNGFSVWQLTWQLQSPSPA